MKGFTVFTPCKMYNTFTITFTTTSEIFTVYLQHLANLHHIRFIVNQMLTPVLPYLLYIHYEVMK